MKLRTYIAAALAGNHHIFSRLMFSSSKIDAEVDALAKGAARIARACGEDPDAQVDLAPPQVLNAVLHEATTDHEAIAAEIARLRSVADNARIEMSVRSLGAAQQHAIGHGAPLAPEERAEIDRLHDGLARILEAIGGRRGQSMEDAVKLAREHQQKAIVADQMKEEVDRLRNGFERCFAALGLGVHTEFSHVEREIARLRSVADNARVDAVNLDKQCATSASCHREELDLIAAALGIEVGGTAYQIGVHASEVVKARDLAEARAVSLIHFVPPATLCGDLQEAAKRAESDRAELSRLRIQLAACLMAAEGSVEALMLRQGQPAWSPALGRVQAMWSASIEHERARAAWEAQRLEGKAQNRRLLESANEWRVRCANSEHSRDRALADLESSREAGERLSGIVTANGEVIQKLRAENERLAGEVASRVDEDPAGFIDALRIAAGLEVGDGVSLLGRIGMLRESFDMNAKRKDAEADVNLVLADRLDRMRQKFSRLQSRRGRSKVEFGRRVANLVERNQRAREWVAEARRTLRRRPLPHETNADAVDANLAKAEAALR